MEHRKLVVMLGAALLAAAVVGGAVAAFAGESGAAAVTEVENDGTDAAAEDVEEGPDQPITGPDLEKASAKALDYLGEGRVTETEIEDEESYYEVEVTLSDGRQVDVQLDEAFNVVGTD